jgi:hypothetical protein
MTHKNTNDNQNAPPAAPADHPKPKPITYKEFAAGKPEADPSWVPPRDFGSALNELSMADSG